MTHAKNGAKPAQALDAHAALLVEYKAAVELLYDAKVVADWALGDCRRLRVAAHGMASGSRMRVRTMMAALCRMEEHDQALRVAVAASKRIGPLLDRLTGSEGAFERAIEAELESRRAPYVEDPELAHDGRPERLDS